MEKMCFPISVLREGRHFPLGTGPWVVGLCQCCPLVDITCSAAIEYRIELLFLRAFVWRELPSLTVGDPNPCQRPAYVWFPRFPLTVLHWNSKDTSIELAVKFVSQT